MELEHSIKFRIVIKIFETTFDYDVKKPDNF